MAAEIIIELDLTGMQELLPSVEWAVESELLSEQEAAEILAEAITVVTR